MLREYLPIQLGRASWRGSRSSYDLKHEKSPGEKHSGKGLGVGTNLTNSKKRGLKLEQSEPRGRRGVREAQTSKGSDHTRHSKSCALRAIGSHGEGLEQKRVRSDPCEHLYAGLRPHSPPLSRVSMGTWASHGSSPDLSLLVSKPGITAPISLGPPGGRGEKCLPREGTLKRGDSSDKLRA